MSKNSDFIFIIIKGKGNYKFTTYRLRFVKWPKYIRLQRQKVVLQTRLKVSLKTSDNVIAYKVE